MIVVDIETSGLFPEKHGIWQIGALDFYNPQNTFLQEGRIDKSDRILNNPGDKKTVYEITGLKDEDFRDKKKQSQKKLLKNFFDWAESVKIKNCICQNPQFDLGFINKKANEYGLKIPFHHRAFDLHSFAIFKYHQLHGKFLIKEDHSDMSLAIILESIKKTNPKNRYALSGILIRATE